MAKSTALNVTQNLNNVSALFTGGDAYSLIAVAPTTLGSNLTPGTRTFTAAGGTLATGGVGAATWSCNASGGAGAAAILGAPTITQPGSYTPGNGPTAAANAATVDSGTSNATWALTTGILKTLLTASANDEVVKSLSVASTDTAARILSLWLKDASGLMQLLCSINVPIGAGNSAGTTAAVDLLASAMIPGLVLDQNGKRVLPLKAGTVLYASVPAVTLATFISVSCGSEQY